MFFATKNKKKQYIDIFLSPTPIFPKTRQIYVKIRKQKPRHLDEV